MTYRNGKTQMFPLSFHELHNTLTTINGVTVGDLYDQYGNVLLDQPAAAALGVARRQQPARSAGREE